MSSTLASYLLGPRLKSWSRESCCKDFHGFPQFLVAKLQDSACNCITTKSHHVSFSLVPKLLGVLPENRFGFRWGHYCIHIGSGANLASYTVNARGFYISDEADREPLSSPEVKNAWNYTSTHPYVFMAWHLIGYRDNFTFN